MASSWFVRAGEGGYLAEEFAKGWVAIGWSELGNLAKLTSRESIRESYGKYFPESNPGKTANAVAVIFKFRTELQVGDNVVTYNPVKREYLVGTIQSDYVYDQNAIKGYPHLRKVKWNNRVSRDLLPVSSRNSLGSALTLFALDGDVWGSIQAALAGDAEMVPIDAKDERAALEESREDILSKAHELIKDQILRLSDSDLEQLSAALLRSMGYRTRVTPRGPDRGMDVFASPDGLGFQEPRIKVEVKHRSKTLIGSPELRSFLGGLREGDRGLYISTGGFTKEAKYEAERSNIPVTLLDLDALANSIATYYETFDSDGRVLLPLVKMYWPTAAR